MTRELILTQMAKNSMSKDYLGFRGIYRDNFNLAYLNAIYMSVLQKAVILP